MIVFSFVLVIIIPILHPEVCVKALSMDHIMTSLVCNLRALHVSWMYHNIRKLSSK